MDRINVWTTALVLQLSELRNRLRDREEGQAIVEYVLIIAFVSLVIIAAFTVFNNNFKTFVTNLGGDL